MCETKFKLEDLRSNSPSFCEDIVDGFAFASFVCEDDLKVNFIYSHLMFDVNICV